MKDLPDIQRERHETEMRILEYGPYKLNNTAVCIGKFDGLHSGHQLLLDSIRESVDLTKVLFTFRFSDSKHIYSSEEKRYLAEKLGIEVYIDRPFDEELSHMKPQAFLEDILIRQCGAKVISVGEDFRFGYKRQGDVAFLKKYSSVYGYELKVFPKKKMCGEPVSSTRIREKLEKGSIETVNQLLGHPYFIYGEVCRGNQIGRTIQMPTVNQLPEQEKLLPPYGVYASRIHTQYGEYIGVTNVGVKPTIPGENRVGVETYIMDFDREIYGEMICVELFAFLRGERKFSGLDTLKIQLEEDKKNAYLFFRQ